MSIDIQRVNSYNERLKKAKEKGSQLRNEIEYSKRELNRLCEELTQTLGETVTIENVAEVYKRETEKIEKTLQIGEEILSRIDGNNSSTTQGITAETRPVDTSRVETSKAFGGSTGAAEFMQAAQKHNAEVHKGNSFDEFGFSENPDDDIKIGTVGDIGNMFGNLGL